MKNKRKRGQSAIEFVIIFGFVLFSFVVFFAIIQNNQAEKNKEKERIIVQNVALDVQDEINLAAESSDGYSREFKTPLNILGKDYEINITDNFIQVKMGVHVITYKVFQVTGLIQKGPNIIKKENGTVYLN